MEAEVAVDDWRDANNNALFKYPGKARSHVWAYFWFLNSKPGLPSKENLDMRFTICIICKRSYANKGNQLPTLPKTVNSLQMTIELHNIITNYISQLGV